MIPAPFCFTEDINVTNHPVIIALSVPVDDRSTAPEVSLSVLKTALNDSVLPLSGVDLVLLPMSVIHANDRQAKEKTELFRSFARLHHAYLVYNQEKDGQCVSVILDRDGSEAGRYAKTHRIKGLDSIDRMGDELPVFSLDFAKVALAIGTDIFFPELAEVYSVLGAEILLCSMGSSPLRDDTMWQRLLRARALEMYLFVAAATYCSCSPMYMTNNFEFVRSEKAFPGSGHDINVNGLGKHTGRAVIYDLRGETLACSGREAGAAAAVLRMEQKRDAVSHFLIPGILKKQNLRGTFDLITHEYPYVKKEYPVKTARISLVQLPYKGTIGRWVPDEEDHFDPQLVFDAVSAAAKGSDLVVLSELSSPTHLLTHEMELRYQRLAGENHCYLLVNHEIQMDSRRNYSILYDRDGTEIMRYEKVNGLQYIYEDIETIGFELPVAELDFATVGVMICADCYSPEIARLLSLKGADLLLIQTQSWGPDSQSVNEGRYRAWAIENHIMIAAAGFANSQVGNRSCVIDTTGETVFASHYDCTGIFTYSLDMEKGLNTKAFIYEDDSVVCTRDFKELLRHARRPELYRALSSEGMKACYNPEK